MPFPASFLDELNNRNPIEDVVGQYVSLTRKGSNLFGLCPFHSEKTPSFSVAPDKGIYYCFGCHKGGGAINFIMEIESLSYPDAVRFLAKRAGLEVPEDEEYRAQYKRTERLYALCKDAARWFRKQLLADAETAAKYGDTSQLRALGIDTRQYDSKFAGSATQKNTGGAGSSAKAVSADFQTDPSAALYAAGARIANTGASIPVDVYKGRGRQDTPPRGKLRNR